ncbi:MULTISPECIES: ribosomal protection-like ABC-F family protein [Sutcliffiella]|uniref:ABC transporter ATP-binding protein n=1 Tax=Sutcliffiella cohnii TaxID=33932 RepID=A0A223KPC8_9BACI|nr:MULTISPECIES: ABC-F type ribosomal protection protein [Sutcliffiella]AST91204.1 ABC transporter ATP-binding protein [Sutcliffiella cohnii]WBL17019.1 ABC-F type ribosomal protection protein [Sutcliffiella sp. NC1]
MITCSVNSVTKMYGGNTIFENISFEMKEKERVGLVGRNGCGKTTLLRLLANKEAVDGGQIHWKKGLEIGYLAQIPAFEQNLTTKEVLQTAFADLITLEAKMKSLEVEMSRERNEDTLQQLMNVYGNLQEQYSFRGGYEIDATIEKIVNGLNISSLLGKSFATLSGGEKTKVGLAISLLHEPDLLLLDEPTNHLDLTAVEWLGHFLRDYSGTVVVVSHDRYFLDEVVNKIIDLEDGEVTCYHTNFSGFVKEKEERLLNEFQAYEEQQKKIKKMKEAIKRLREWANRANPPNEGLHKRARNMERALERMEKVKRPILNRKKMDFEMEANDRTGKDVITLRNVEKRFGDKLLFQHVNLHVMYKDRVAIIGENGTGKSTLIKLILRQIEADSGEVRVGSNVKIGYLSQHIFPNMKEETIIDVFRDEVRVTEGEARSILAKFLFYGPTVYRKVSQLSGGERMRLRLAQLMYQDVNVLILDEPTNHLDIDSREVLEEALEDFNGTILAVSHDRYFLNKLFEKIYWIQSGSVDCFVGDYDYAKKKMAERVLESKQEVVEKKVVVKHVVTNSGTKNGKENVELKIAKLEDKIIEIESQLAELDDLETLQSLYAEKEKLEQQWEELSEQL